MFYAFFYGLGTGIVLSAMLGTVFFSLIQNSIDNGIKSSMYLSSGVIFSDIILITVGYLNASFIPKGGKAEAVVRLIGGLFIIGLGVSNIYKKTKILFPSSGKKPMLLAIKGFTLNFFNPGNFLSWLAVSALVKNVLHFTVPQRIIFYLGAITAIFGMEFLISYGAVKLKRFMSPLFLRRVNVVLGFVFLVFGVVLLWPLILQLF